MESKTREAAALIMDCRSVIREDCLLSSNQKSQQENKNSSFPPTIKAPDSIGSGASSSFLQFLFGHIPINVFCDDAFSFCCKGAGIIIIEFTVCCNLLVVDVEVVVF